MTTPVHQGIITGGYLPVLRNKVSRTETNLYLHDYYEEIFKPLGIYRDELMLILPQLLRVDLLTGTDDIPYKESTKNDTEEDENKTISKNN